MANFQGRSSSTEIRGLIWISIAVLLGLFISQTILVSIRKPMTCDEFSHLASGYSYLKTGQLRFDHEEPPLIKLIAALPLIFLDSKIPTDHESWKNLRHDKDNVNNVTEFVRQFFFYYNTNVEGMFFWARLPLIGLSALLGYFIFRWARNLYGPQAGLCALFLYIFDPNILAHSGLINTDMGLSCFMFITIYYIWSFLQNTINKTALICAGLSLGLALVTKFSALGLISICLLLFLLPRPRNRITTSLKSFTQGGAQNALLPLYYFCILLLLAFIVMLLPYRMVLSDYFMGLKIYIDHLQRGHPAFLLGQYSDKGWWYYFIVAFAVKTPILILLLFLASLVSFFINSNRIYDELFLLIPIGILFMASTFSRVNIGIRHILPVYPFIFVFISKLSNKPIKGVGLKILVIFLSLYYVFGSIRNYPHYLSYFNELIGGPDNGYKYLSDSNLSWGQDIKELKRFLERNKIGKIKLYSFYLGTSDYGPFVPELSRFYRINYEELTKKEIYLPSNGIFAIDIVDLQNVYHPDKSRFCWIKLLKPFARVGESLWVYKIDLKGEDPITFFQRSFLKAKMGEFLFANLERVALFLPYFSPISKFYQVLSEEEIEELGLKLVSELKIGKIDIGQDDDFFIGRGWSGRELWENRFSFRWTLGKESELFIPLNRARDYLFSFKAIPFSPGGILRKQVIKFFLNKKYLSQIILEDQWKEYRLSIPSFYWKKGLNKLTLRYVYSARPADFFNSNDRRDLAVAFDYFRLEEDSER